jgi:FkbM family methyltransferase
MVKRVIGKVQGILAHTPLALHCAVKLQNQCKAIIGRAHGASIADHHWNGEAAIVKQLSGKIRYFVDVGANRGSWTGLVLESNNQIAGGLLFEPAASALQILASEFASRPQIEIVPAAVSDSPGEAVFFEEEEAGETSSLSVTAAHAHGRSRTVRVTTLDSELSVRQWPIVDFLKIDAEGYDFHVLRGARNLLGEGRVKAGQFEYGEAWRDSGSTLTRALAFLKDLDYQVYLLKNDGLYHPDISRFGEYFGYSNYIFVRSQYADLFGNMKLRSL